MKDDESRSRSASAGRSTALVVGALCGAVVIACLVASVRRAARSDALDHAPLPNQVWIRSDGHRGIESPRLAPDGERLVQHIEQTWLGDASFAPRAGKILIVPFTHDSWDRHIVMLWNAGRRYVASDDVAKQARETWVRFDWDRETIDAKAVSEAQHETRR